MKRAIIMTGKFATDCEYVYPFYRLQEAGFEVDVAVRGGETVFGIIGEKIVPTMDIPSGAMRQASCFDDGWLKDCKLLVLPGGAKAMEYMRQDQDVIDFIAAFHAQGRIVASICHAAQLLISAKLVRGREISGYYSIRDDIENAGGRYVDEPAVVDSRIVTTAHYKNMAPWMAAALAEVDAVDRQKEKIVKAVEKLGLQVQRELSRGGSQ